MVAEVATTPNESTRTYVSLLLFMHLFCVAVVLSGNHFPSRLQTKLAKTLGIYTKTLHLDPSFASFELTDGERGLTQLHQWEVIELDDALVFSIPGVQDDSWVQGGFQRSRGERYARLAAFYATTESLDDEVCATMARDLASYHFATKAEQTSKTQNSQSTDHKRLLIRCVSLGHEDVQTEDSKEPASEAIYEVDAWQTDDGGLQILKRMEARRTAPSPSD